ncbi:hypothetical protein C2G38_1980978, partial [Gigaspora rosea]
FGATLIKIGTIQRRLAWPLHKDDTFNLEWMRLRVQNFFCFHSKDVLVHIYLFLTMVKTR